MEVTSDSYSPTAIAVVLAAPIPNTAWYPVQTG